jgi:hypothetical protein
MLNATDVAQLIALAQRLDRGCYCMEWADDRCDNCEQVIQVKELANKIADQLMVMSKVS